MKQILLFGAGKSATVLINYLKITATEKQWMVIVADMNCAAVQAKIGEHKWVKAVCLSIENEVERKALIVKADVVISLLPPSLHYIVALDCLAMRKHLLTASYEDEKIKLLENEIKQRAKTLATEGKMKPAEEKALQERMCLEGLTERERQVMEKGISNLEFHYLGSAKILGGIGKGLAESRAELKQLKRIQ